MARLRSKSCRNKIFTERVSSGEAESLGANPPAGECGVKDQVRRADSLIFVEDELKHRMIYGRNAMGCPVFLFVCVNVDSKKVCTAQNYVKLMISMSQNIADSCISDVTHTCLFDVDVAVRGVEIGVSHAGSDELAFYTGSVQHGSIGVPEFTRIQLG